MRFASKKIVAIVSTGALTLAFTAAQPPGPSASPTVKTVAIPLDPAPLPDPVKTANPLGAMLSEAKTAYSKVRDYSCLFSRQERIRDVLGVEQVAEMKVRAKPFGVAVRFAKPESVAGLEERYAAGSRLDKVKYRPAGAKGVNGFQLVSLDDPKILAETRHPINGIGIGATIELLISMSAREKALGNTLEVFTSDYQFGGKNVTRYEIFAKRAHAHRYAFRTLVYVDKESKLPMRLEAYSEPKPGMTVGELLECYSYTEVKLNVGIGESAFE